MSDTDKHEKRQEERVLRRRSGGRAGRTARHARNPILAAPKTILRTIPLYALLDEEALYAIETQADRILAEIGVEFPDDEEARALFREAGAEVKGTRIRFDPGLARSLCASAPRAFQMYGRTPDHRVTIGGDHVVFTPAYGPPFVTDLDRGRRYATIEDFRNFVKLGEQTPYLHHSGGTVCEPVDLPVNKRHLDMVYAHLRLSTKPFMGAVTAPDRAEDSIEMARIAYGASFLEDHCVIQGNINVNSPLVFDGVMTGALKVYSRANQGVVLSPFILGGAMGPVTMPALIAQSHAEAMVGIALTQLVRKGAPVVYGNFLTTLNLKTGSPTFGTPEANLATFAVGQLCRRLGLPLRCGGHLTAAKSADGQAMQESADSMTAGLMAGANYVLHAAGWLEGGLTMGYEKFVMDLDRCGMMQTFLAGLSVDDNTLGVEAYRQAGPGDTFFGIPHTLKNFETANYMSDLADTLTYEQWAEQGRKTLERRAAPRWKQMLAEYEAPAIDPAVDEALLDFMAQRKQGVGDEWY